MWELSRKTQLRVPSVGTLKKDTAAECKNSRGRCNHQVKKLKPERKVHERQNYRAQDKGATAECRNSREIYNYRCKPTRERYRKIKLPDVRQSVPMLLTESFTQCRCKLIQTKPIMGELEGRLAHHGRRRRACV